MFNEKKIDFCTRFDNLNTEKESFLDRSPPVYAEKLHLGQFTNYPQSFNLDSLAFLEHSSMIVNLILIGFLITTIFIFCFQLIDSNKSNSKTITNIHRIRTKKAKNRNRFYLKFRRLINFFRIYYHLKKGNLLTIFNLIMLFYLSFLQINLNLIKSNIKTNEILIDAADLIDSILKLKATKRFVCFFENDPNYKLIQNSENEIFKILNQKLKDDKTVCFLDSKIFNYDQLKKIKTSKTLFLMNKSSLYIFLSSFSSLVNKQIFFETAHLFNIEFIQVHYISSSLVRNLKKQLKHK